MDTDLFLQNLLDLPLEEGKVYIRTHIDELSDHAAIGNLLADEALRLLYSPFVSLKLAELLIFYGEYVQHTSSHALGFKAKGHALMMIGYHQAALDALDAAGEKFLSLGDEVDWARSRIGWIVSAAWLGHVDEALQAASQARDVFLQRGEIYWVCCIDHNTAMIYDHIGRYQDALKLYESMRALYPAVTNQKEKLIKRSLALAEMNQAISLTWLGHFEQAYQLLRQAQASFVALKETYLIVKSEVNLADLDYAQGFYGSALRRYYQTCDTLIQNNIDDPLLLAKLKLWIATCLVKLNRAREASLLSEEAVKTYLQFGMSLSIGDALRTHASTLQACGRLQEALTTLEKAWNLLHSGGFDHHASATRLQLAELLLEMGNVDPAYEQASQIRQSSEIKGLVPYSAGAGLIMVGALLEKIHWMKVEQGKEQQSPYIQEAMSLCEWIISQARQHNLQGELYKSLYLLGRLWFLQGDFVNASSHYTAAISQIDQILDDLIYDLSPSFLYKTWVVYEDMINLCLQQGQIEPAFGYLEQARSMALRQYINKFDWKQIDTIDPSIKNANKAIVLRLQKELEDWQGLYRDFSATMTNLDSSTSFAVDPEIIQGELKRCEEKIDELFERLHLYQTSFPLKANSKERVLHHVDRVDIEQLHQHLSPNQLLLAYFLSRGKLVIFIVTADSVVTCEVANGMEELEQLLPLLHAHLDPRGWPNSQIPSLNVVQRLLKRLYNILVDPVTKLLPPKSGLLTIVPYGPLHKLPFHALFDGSQYLIENYRINYLPASSLLLHFGALNHQKHFHTVDRGAIHIKPLVFGYSEHGHLQRVKDEAQTIASLVGGTCYLDNEATIARLIENAPGSPIIHLSTHGQSRLDAPNFSYIRLADGHLNAVDAFSLDLRECELVTLSGCETGLALSGGGDEQLGLGRAFLAAGASSLVISLWPVEDTATNKLMKHFYEDLLKEESKVQALRTAQCQLMQDAELNFAHPYFWAAFRLVGDPAPLKTRVIKDVSPTFEIELLKKDLSSVSKM